MMELRVAAVAAPDRPFGRVDTRSLTSADPASLFNACRVAAESAVSTAGAWSHSNWSGTRAQRRKSLLMMESLSGSRDALDELLVRVSPHLLLIGSMTPCLPGAIACAARARELLGNDVCIVLGGRHVNETMFLEEEDIRHHPGSPLRLMHTGAIPRVFDLVVAGEGEDVIRSIGAAIATSLRDHKSPASPNSFVPGLECAAGSWIAGWIDGHSIHHARGREMLDRDSLPSPSDMFGVGTKFDVFGGALTAHVFSDSGNGCAFDCGFCSERKAVTGGLVDPFGGPRRLHAQLVAAARVVGEDAPQMTASAFCEDSTLLGGSPRALYDLVERIRRGDARIPFGAQLTIDQVLRREKELHALREAGLCYLFIGIETPNPTAIGGMSKDLNRTSSWLHRTESALALLARLDYKVGAAILFGLGESHESRTLLLTRLAEFRLRYGSPSPVSFNWASQHPLAGDDGATGYTYHEWSIPEGPFSNAFSFFGEATVRYPLAGVAPPVLEEVHDLVDMAYQLDIKARHDNSH